MPVRGVLRNDVPIGSATGAHAPIYVDSDDNKLKMIPAGSGTTEVEVVDASSVQTLTNKTLTAPVLTAPVVSGAGSGVARVAGGVITELTGDATYSISVVLPAGAVLLDIQITGQALWTAVTSATLKVGDAVDDDGYATGCDVKTAPAVGSTFSLFSEAAMGTVDGAYLNTDSIVGPTATNFGLYFPAGTTIKATVTKVGAGTAGRTGFFVIYAVPEAVAQVVV